MGKCSEYQMYGYQVSKYQMSGSRSESKIHGLVHERGRHTFQINFVPQKTRHTPNAVYIVQCNMTILLPIILVMVTFGLTSTVPFSKTLLRKVGVAELVRASPPQIQRFLGFGRSINKNF